MVTFNKSAIGNIYLNLLRNLQGMSKLNGFPECTKTDDLKCKAQDIKDEYTLWCLQLNCIKIMIKTSCYCSMVGPYLSVIFCKRNHQITQAL